MTFAPLYTAAWLAALAAAPAVAMGAALPTQTLAAVDIADLSIEELARLPVTSVAGRPQATQEAAASIYVMTGADIRRSGATSLPEALRLAPNLQVARLNAGQYAISARGSNNAIGNKLLVMIDGRTVYSPLFSGVFWDQQDLLLQDIERIEVVSGPGGTLWGANAVNGVINVITRNARDTTGTLAAARASATGSSAALRQGGALGEHAHWRAYAMRLQRDNTERPDGVERLDASAKEQAGFRVDWGVGGDSVTVQGDTYRAGADARSNLSPILHGTNLVARWRREAEDGSQWQLQGWFDDARRQDAVLFTDTTRTLDLQFTQVLRPMGAHRWVWGAGWRQATSSTGPTLVVFDPAKQQLHWANVFGQDEWAVSDALKLTLGTKVETNRYTGTELLPTLRATWTPAEGRTLWGGLSRAVRAPSRIDREFYFPASGTHSINGGPDFGSETADVAEVGWRHRVGSGLSYSLTAFDQRYRGLRGGQPSPTTIQNRIDGHVYGLEAWGQVELHPGWRVSAGLVELRKSLTAAPGSSPTSISDLGNDPKRQWSLRASATPWAGWELDVGVRHVGALPQPAVDAYTATDLRAAWHATPQITLSLQVQNMFEPSHVEFNAPATASVIRRSAWLGVEMALR